MAFDPDHVRPEFPILSRRIGGRPLVYLDSAASAPKPEAVIGAMTGARAMRRSRWPSGKAQRLSRAPAGIARLPKPAVTPAVNIASLGAIYLRHPRYPQASPLVWLPFGK
jgi:hypothetical protein